MLPASEHLIPVRPDTLNLTAGIEKATRVRLDRVRLRRRCHQLVALDEDLVIIRDRPLAEPADAAVMNHNQIENCVGAVFCCEPLSDEEVATIRRCLDFRQVAPPCADGWQLELIDYDLNPNLSFLQLANSGAEDSS